MDGEAAESFIAEKRIGERIKHLRLKKSMGLVELGRHTGLSASFLSQLETGRVVPTLRNLARIAMVFSKDLSYFFEPEPRTLFRMHRRDERVRLPQTGVDDPSYFFESLGYHVPDRQLDPYFAEFLPVKEGRVPRAHQHAGCEFLYLLSGTLDVRHGETTHHVEAGDAIYFDANTIHSYRLHRKDARHSGDCDAATSSVDVGREWFTIDPIGHRQGSKCTARGASRSSDEEERGADAVVAAVLFVPGILVPVWRG